MQESFGCVSPKKVTLTLQESVKVTLTQEPNPRDEPNGENDDLYSWVLSSCYVLATSNVPLCYLGSDSTQL